MGAGLIVRYPQHRVDLLASAPPRAVRAQGETSMNDGSTNSEERALVQLRDDKRRLDASRRWPPGAIGIPILALTAGAIWAEESGSLPLSLLLAVLAFVGAAAGFAWIYMP